MKQETYNCILSGGGSRTASPLGSLMRGDPRDPAPREPRRPVRPSSRDFDRRMNSLTPASNVAASDPFVGWKSSMVAQCLTDSEITRYPKITYDWPNPAAASGTLDQSQLRQMSDYDIHVSAGLNKGISWATGCSGLCRSLSINAYESYMSTAKSRPVATTIAVEYFRTREYSMFRWFINGTYICDAIEPSLHDRYESWPVGGRGGLPTGIYWWKPYWWKDKQKPVWSAAGDAARGAIIPHSGNSVQHSKGCFIMGLGDAPGHVKCSTIATNVVWSLMRSYVSNGSSYSPANGFLVLRSNIWESLKP